MASRPIAEAGEAPSALPDADVSPGGRCPVDHGAAIAAAATGCPVDHDGGPAPASRRPGCPIPQRRAPVRRSRADLFVRRMLRIPDRPAGVTQAAVYAAFQRSMLVSATRCTLTYVIFPFVLPAVGFAAQGAVGVLVGVVAMVCDVFTIRRFFAVDHRWRWYFAAIVFGIMGLLTALLVQDISHLARG